ncbi:MAG: hypothetical protein GWN79_20670 [Actinobacteria bacterium]|nr:hypothetical protein [Actinomycetota bacterium]NIS29320.1 hypothetical protein [Actinomycetota bacterium]NIT94460.1 hypothetical protein [Actinomycetota bacterium]NIU21331.1 hypothetical protein [Actinomycetota bacterium]NIV54562.1 hypothetical protein [Actinomycetota bacterium]
MPSPGATGAAGGGGGEGFTSFATVSMVFGRALLSPRGAGAAAAPLRGGAAPGAPFSKTARH